MKSLKELLELDIIHLKNFNLTVAELLSSIFIIGGAWVILYFLKNYVLKVFYRRKGVNVGQQYAVNQLISYTVYPIAIILAMQALGFQISVVLAGGAALMVGVGLGLQQTFKDIFSGIILLVEGAVKVDDMVVIEDTIVMVKEIGLRTSKVETRDETVKIIPNSKLVEDTVINWSHNNRPTRFHVDVGVAYGSNLALVQKLLLQAASEHPKILSEPPVVVQFREFNSSSLDFKLFFFSLDFLKIEVVKSDLRFRIDELFRQNKITIPFPQQEVWFKNELVMQARGEVK
ncbi:MAG: mechanosensitive ion channel [Spirosomataceae bacterium]